MTPEIWLALIGAVVAIGGTIAGAVKWAVGRMAKATDDSTLAIIKNSASDAVVTAKLDEVIGSNERVVVALTRLGDLLAPLAKTPTKQRRTNPLGTPVIHLRATSNHEDE